LVLLLFYLQWLPFGLQETLAERVHVWLGLVAFLFVAAGVHYLNLRADIRGTFRARLVANIVSTVVSGIMLVGAGVFLVLFAGLFTSMFLVPLLRDVLPAGLGDYLGWFQREPGLFVLSVAIGGGVAVAAASTFAYRWLRRPEESIGEAFAPSLNILILFVVSVLLLLSLTAIPLVAGVTARAFGAISFATWVQENFAHAVGYGYLASLGAIVGLYLYRRQREPDSETKSATFLRSIYSIWITVVAVAGCAMLVLFVVGAALLAIGVT
jgi:hypothetical protein